MNIDFTKDGKIVFIKPYTVTTDTLTFTFPKGFKSDGASLPWFIHWFGDPYDGDTLDAALVHDAYYDTKGEAIFDGEHFKVARVVADLMFLKIMKEHKVGLFKRYAYVVAVRLFGWYPWLTIPKRKTLISVKLRKNVL